MSIKGDGMEGRKNGDFGKEASSSSTSKNTTGTPPKATKNQDYSIIPRRSARSTRYSGYFFNSGANSKRSQVGLLLPPSEETKHKNTTRKRTVEVHSPPPPDPESEMMRVWFPPPETLAHVDFNRIPASNARFALFSRKAVAEYRAMLKPPIPASASICKRIRHQDAELFPTWYKYDESNNDEMKDKVTFICSDGSSHPRTEQSSGIPWVAVHGGDQICVVGMQTFKVLSRSSLPITGIGRGILHSFGQKCVAEMEAIESQQLSHQGFRNGPFAVVSVVRNPDHYRSSSEATWAAIGAEQCITFLVDKLKDASDFSYDETIKTAMSAMLHLFCHKLTIGDLTVNVATKSDGQVRVLLYNAVKEMWPLSETLVQGRRHLVQGRSQFLVEGSKKII